MGEKKTTAGTHRLLCHSESSFPPYIPRPWMAGYIHHHTDFNFPEQRQTPGELRREVENLGGDFFRFAQQNIQLNR